MLENHQVIGVDREYSEKYKKWERSLPVCSICNEYIYDEYCREFGDLLIHEECYNEFFESVPDKYKEFAEQIKEELDYSASYTQVFTPKKEI